MNTLTPTQQAAIAATVERMQLTRGLGDSENGCSIAAINLALSGELTDKVPDCMSVVIGNWIIAIQDRMPDDMRNSLEWKRLLPLAAGTGRDHEPERLAMVMDWMWEALMTVQPIADANGFGIEWAAMCTARTEADARAAEAAADAAAAFNAADAAAAYAAAYAADAAAAYAVAAAYAADAAAAYASAVVYIARAAAYASAVAYTARAVAAAAYAVAVARAARDGAYAVRAAAAYAADTTSLSMINPPALLERLINL